MDRIRATYRIETPYPPEQAAEVLAGEQSSGTFVKVPGETAELKERFHARVESVDLLGQTDAPALPGSRDPQGETRWQRAEIVVSWSLDNMGPSLPNLMSTVCGNLWELSQFSGLKLLDLSLPDAFADHYPGPQFGIDGTRGLSGVAEGPLIGTIVKPSVGMSPEDTAALVDELAGAGIDFIKDDELMANPPHSPFEKRVEAVMAVINRHAERTGRKVMYAFNITDEIDAMRRHHDTVMAAGGTCVMMVMNSVGLPGFAWLRRHSQLPIHAHRAGWGLFDRSPWLGMSYVAYQKFWRAAGADHLHVSGIRNKFYESDESVVSSARACLTPLFDRAGRADLAMPVFSSAQWADQAHDTYRALGSADLIYCAGGGIMAHPGGVEAGVASLKDAWQAAMSGETLASKARTSSALAQAIEHFGHG